MPAETGIRETVLPDRFEALLCRQAVRLPADACWALACGSALALHGIDHCPADLDFFTLSRDIERVQAALDGVDVLFPLATRRSGAFSSIWGRYVAEGIEIDVVADFTVTRDASLISWDWRHPCWRRLTSVSLRGVEVRLFSLEDLRLFYRELEGEHQKVDKISRALGDAVHPRL